MVLRLDPLVVAHFSAEVGSIEIYDAHKPVQSSTPELPFVNPAAVFIYESADTSRYSGLILSNGS